MTELQVLDTQYPGKLAPYQYHGSVYGLIPAARGYLYEAGNWNYEEVTVQGTKIKVELNGAVILDADERFKASVININSIKLAFEGADVD